MNDIDPIARRKLAELARHFAVGHLSNNQLEDAAPESAEGALHDIWFRGLWPL